MQLLHLLCLSLLVLGCILNGKREPLRLPFLWKGEDAVFCCRRTRETPIPRRIVQDYRLQLVQDGCNIPAAVFITTKGKRLCAPLQAPWVIRLQEKLDASSARKRSPAISAFQVSIFPSIGAFQVSILLVIGAFQVSIPLEISAFQVSRSSWGSDSILQEIPDVDMDLALLAPYHLQIHQRRDKAADVAVDKGDHEVQLVGGEQAPHLDLIGLLALSTKVGRCQQMEAIRRAGSTQGEGGHMLSKGGCAEGPVPAAELARAVEMSQAAACILFWHSAWTGLRKGLSPPLQAPGKGADLFGYQPCCLPTSCKGRPRAGISPGATHLFPGPAPSARRG
ncbi:PREDICTED: C-C motif chemokine 19 [Charadrius vociferus]|uniref:C-C motif chemokine 19 n=1 Tax=Charadrius vociferus TaxID=50402 RepID=UPI0005218963|nr:PREDICTED: C-C motif chemokine 19 [Charadrius vociferus]